MESTLLTYILDQGPTIAVMATAIWFFYRQFNSLQKKLNVCTESRMAEYKAANERMVKVLERNNNLIEQLLNQNQ